MMIDEAMRRAQASRSRQPGPRPGYNGSLTVFSRQGSRPGPVDLQLRSARTTWSTHPADRHNVRVPHAGVVDVVRGRRRSVWNADARRISFDVVGIRRRTRTLIARDRAHARPRTRAHSSP